MDANELRIGNWVKEEDGRFVYIHDTLGIDHHSQFHPIPLTPEILEKAGFEKDEDFEGRFHHVNKIVTVEFEDGIIRWMDNTYIYHQEIKHLHKLQNLYFAIIGDELEINL